MKTTMRDLKQIDEEHGMPRDRKVREETRHQELRRQVSATRVKARVNVGYYDTKAEGLNKRIRWAAAIAAGAAIVVAGSVPWTLRFEGLIYFTMLLALIGAGAIIWSGAMDWAADLAGCLKTRGTAHFIETEADSLFARLDLRDYGSLEEMLRQFQYLQQRWELVGHTAPSEAQDTELVRKLQEEAEKSLGLKRDKQRVTTPTDPRY